jgi:hypothetical protein
MMKELILADFRERTRRYSFLVTLGFVLFYAYLVITGKYTLTLGDCRGVYNAAWTGSLMAVGSTMMLMIFGFYLVNNTIRRDRLTGVGEILTTTSLSKTRYMTAKFLSNTLTLTTMVAILIPAALFMQIFIGVTDHFNLWAFLSPFIFISLPMIVFVSALAVLFESIKLLRSSLGNVIYFFIFQFIVIISLESHIPLLDFLGAGTIIPHMQAAAQSAHPTASIGLTMGFITTRKDPNTLLGFIWEGYPWPAEVIISKLLIVGFSFLLILLAAYLFKGFSADKSQNRVTKKEIDTVSAPESRQPKLGADPLALEPIHQKFSIFSLIKAELRVMLKGLNRFWYIAALGLTGLQFFLPQDIVLQYILPSAWIWPLILWSSMGTRDQRFRTSDLLMCSPHPLSRQLPASWISGVLLTLAMGSGMIIRSLLTGQIFLFLSLLIASLFIPSMALFLGKLSGSRKLFEMVFLFLWYLGPIKQLPVLNFMASDVRVAHSLVPLLFLLLTILMVSALPLIGRGIQEQ